MKFRFPIIIIDEDYRSENTSGLGIRAWRRRLRPKASRCWALPATATWSQFAQQQSRASAFILSIDDEEFTAGRGPRPHRAQPAQLHW